MSMKKIRYKGMAINCIRCGKVMLLSNQTDAWIVCPNCGCSFYSYSRGGVVVGITDEQLQGDSRFSAYQDLIQKMDKLGQGMEV